MQSGNPTSSDVRHRRFRVGAFVILTAVLVFASITESDSQATVVRAADRPPASAESVAAPGAEQALAEPDAQPADQTSQEPPSVEVGALASADDATGDAVRVEDATAATTEVYVTAGPGVLAEDPTTVTVETLPATCEMPATSEAATASSGDSPAPPTALVAEDPAVAVPARVGTAVHADTFDVLTPSWQGLAGSWSVEDARLVQSDATGYDLLIEYDRTPPTTYRVSVDMVALDTPLGGGLMIAQPTPMTRNGAFIVDFTEGGAFLRWGKYDNETGQYRYMGGVATPEGFDPTAPHTLAVEQDTTASRVLVDGVTIAEFAPLPTGRTGLVTSVSSVAFDNFTIEDLTNDDR